MPVQKRVEFPDFKALGRGMDDLIRSLPDVVGVMAINFFQDRFTQKGWIDTSFESWNERKDPNAKGSTLLVSGFLKNAFDAKKGSNWLEVTNYAKYSGTHNQGGTITIRITKKSRKYFWFMFSKTGDPKWKAMALTKKDTFTFFIPRRQFMGHSDFFMKRAGLHFINQTKKLTSKHF